MPDFTVAFPCRGFDDPHIQHSSEGMFLRDYFAAQALAGQMAYEGCEGCGNDRGAKDVADWCYEIADAMMERRKV